MGVIGMTLSDNDEIVGMQLDHQGDSLLIVSENGMGKRTSMDEFTVQHRGGKGVKCYKITEKTGSVSYTHLDVYKRQVMYLCRKLTDTSYVNIGKLLGKKDHTTIIHGVNKIEDELKNNDELASKVETIKKKICV